jgi:leucine dehydrogenase
MVSIQKELGAARAGEGEADLFARASSHGIREAHVANVPRAGLKAIVAIHSTRLGPALGGTRCVPYASSAEAFEDAFRLARAMSYKAAIHRLGLGGGKAVMIRPAGEYDREAMFEAYGEFVETLGGRFIAAQDSGTTTADMDVIARRTAHVAGTSNDGDPSPYTAMGVRRAIEAAVAFRGGRDGLTGLHVAVQGVGQAGFHLVRGLVERGARVTVCDIDREAAERCARELGARVVAPSDIYDVEADVFSPCALGGVINTRTLARLKAPMIVGTANNQLEDERLADRLHERGVLHAPDYIANGGGLMKVAGLDGEQLLEKVDAIYHLLLDVFAEARATDTAPLRVADRRAEAMLDPTSER